MNIAELSIRKSVITWMMTLVFVGGGLLSFRNLSRLEDPNFTIKDAVVITPYPGASPAEVEEEVTEVIERAIQQLGQLDKLESRSERGRSTIKLTIKDAYDAARLPQVWDELRRKVGDAQGQLPPGAGPSLVNDDFGDVFGVFFALTGEGYAYADLESTAETLQRELLQVTDVKRVSLFAVQPQVVYVEMRREKMAELGVAPGDIYSALAARNLAAPAGTALAGAELIPVTPTGEFSSEQEFAELLVLARGGEGGFVQLGDVAEIRRGYREPPRQLLRHDGRPAVGIGISTVGDGNAVTMGEAVKRRLVELEPVIPLGMELQVISLQSDAVTAAIDGFVVNLAQAVIIVVVVLLFAMGLRSGLIIGAILFITIAGTFVFMAWKDITLERISLGALVIALGMLVDNAIVVTDGMKVKMEEGVEALRAAKEVVGQTAVPLLGATAVAIAAFASIGVSQDSTGEYCRSLFQVILISLTMSWVTAVTTTPLLCKLFLKQGRPAAAGAPAKDAHGGLLFRAYRGFLATCIRLRWVTVAVAVGLFGLSILGFGGVKQSFFPDSTRPQFYVDFYFAAGTHPEEVARRLEVAEQHLLGKQEVTHVTTMIGGGQVRFLLTYSPEQAYLEFGQILVDVDDYRAVPEMKPALQRELEELYPDAHVNVRMFVNGPSTGGKVQVRIVGDDPDELRRLAGLAEDVFRSDEDAQFVFSEWSNRVKTLVPRMAEAQARRAGLDRKRVAQAMESAVEGTTVGVYREGEDLLPVIARSPEAERTDLTNLQSAQVWSPSAQRMIPMGQVVSDFETGFEDPYVWRYNRARMIRLHVDPWLGLPGELLGRRKAELEKALGVDVAAKLGREVPEDRHVAATIPIRYDDLIPLKDRPGYYLSYGGEAEGSAKAQGALAGQLPLFGLLMVAIVVALFNSVKKAAVIWLCVPLALIGVTAGLLLLRQPFGFMSLLGLLSLSGMLIKNAIVLVDQIGVELESGKSGFQAIVDSGVSRLTPVSMAAATTILGMIPLLKDAFFVSMAVTIMFGLGFATVLTLVIVPVFYAIVFRIPNER
jgi:multidrug efflux pump subunit AcrB